MESRWGSGKLAFNIVLPEGAACVALHARSVLLIGAGRDLSQPAPFGLLQLPLPISRMWAV